MNAKELVDTVAEKIGHTKADVRAILDAAGEVATDALKADGEVVLPGLGKLHAKVTKERTGRNPKTGEPHQIPPKTVAKFSMSKALKEGLN